MQIKRLFLKNYGPIREQDYLFESGFNLVFGKNEQGKSLSFDGLVKLLFKKASKKIKAIDRVQDDPAQMGGFVELSYQQNGTTQTSKLKQETSLTDLTGLDVDTCLNLFLIRNSELSIGSDFADQDRFLTSITDRLTGLQTTAITRTKQQLRDLAQITETNRFQSTQNNQKLAERLQQIKQLLQPKEKIAQLIKQDEQEAWSKMEQQLYHDQQLLQDISLQIEEQLTAQKKEEYLELERLIESLKETNKQLEELGSIVPEQLETLHLTQQAETALKAQQKELQNEIQDKKDRTKELERKLAKINEQIESSTLVREEIERSLQPESLLLMQQAAQIEAQQHQPWKQILIVASILLIISLFFVTKESHWSNLIASLIFTIGTCLSGIKYFLILQQRQQFDTKLKRIQLEMAKLDISAKNLEEVTKKITDLKQESARLNSARLTLTTEQKALRDDLSEIRDKKMGKITALITQQQQSLRSIFDECQVKSEQELIDKLRQKQNLESQQQRQLVLAESKLGKPIASEDTISFYEQELALRTYEKEIAISINFDSSRLASLQTEQGKLNQRIEIHQRALQTLKQDLQTIQREVAPLLPNYTQPVLLEQISDLIQFRQELVQYYNHHIQQRQQALILIALLEEIEAQEKEKVTALFSSDGQIASLFEHITQGEYVGVVYDQVAHTIRVQHKNGQALLANQLSSGTYDQLYFAVRVGLGQQLLADQTGFFIVDDPFLKADQERLSQQLDTLLDLAKKGWQIIYFSAKQEVLSYLQDRVHVIKLSRS
ncbi:MAG TPA: AAA family ATPase [Candidatus Woesebacteria bacterium]|nr:AAA family ATPase [Candidatus Woesebacteria bacterium]